jgi:hypothetical protein
VTVEGPEYVDVDVSVVALARSLDFVSRVRSGMRREVAAFLHPLNGGRDGLGFEFGQGPTALDLLPRLERVEGVDRIESLSFPSSADPQSVALAADALVAVGSIDIEVRIAEEVRA